MNDQPPKIFELFNEIGIINQLSVALFNRLMPDGLHVSHFSVLNHLVRLGDGKTPLAIAQAFQITKGTMTHTLSVLERRGLIRLEANPHDKRSKLVFLTDEGRGFRNNAIQGLAPAAQKLSRKIDMEGLIAILPELTKLRKVLDENRDL
ncbi:MAG: MarR family transcriptional regulator [Pseudomonadota bacterium]